jgi:hypothetical protein
VYISWMFFGPTVHAQVASVCGPPNTNKT